MKGLNLFLVVFVASLMAMTTTGCGEKKKGKNNSVRVRNGGNGNLPPGTYPGGQGLPLFQLQIPPNPNDPIVRSLNGQYPFELIVSDFYDSQVQGQLQTIRVSFDREYAYVETWDQAAGPVDNPQGNPLVAAVKYKSDYPAGSGEYEWVFEDDYGKVIFRGRDQGPNSVGVVIYENSFRSNGESGVLGHYNIPICVLDAQCI